MKQKEFSIEAKETFRNVAKKYLEKRKQFLEIANRTPYLSGNDNIIGRIGEFIAYQYLEDTNRNPQKPNSKTNQGFDFFCDNNTKRIQVKTITHESKFKQNSRLKEPWDEFILIFISENLKVKKMGHITKQQLQKAINNKFEKYKSFTPQVTNYMLGEKGLFARHGRIVNADRYL